nr:RNA polymerase sigma factor [Microbacterium ulmi]
MRQLIARHERRLYAAALRMTQTSWDAEEVVGAAFLELWRRREHVRIVDQSVLPWLLTVVAYAAKNKLRGQRRYKRLLNHIPSADAFPDHADEVARVVDGKAITQAVRKALAEASAQDASVIVLCIVEEMSIRDAAAVLGIPEGTVKSRLSRAKAKLRDRLGPHQHLIAEVSS